MENLNNITRQDIYERISGGELKITRTLALALMGGAVIFLGIILTLYFINLSQPAEVNMDSAGPLMFTVFWPFAAAIAVAFLFISRNLTGTENLKNNLSQAPDPIIALIGLHRTIMIVKLSLLEGISLFGMVSLMLVVLDGNIFAQAHYWLLTLPLMFFVFYGLTNYLSQEKIVDWINDELLLPAKNIN